eukprot:COSAG03_NODE_170_length_11252_cov_12.948893_2_plen_70_part_00
MGERESFTGHRQQRPAWATRQRCTKHDERDDVLCASGKWKPSVRLLVVASMRVALMRLRPCCELGSAHR